MLETTPHSVSETVEGPSGAAPIALSAQRNPLRIILKAVAWFCENKLRDVPSGSRFCVAFDSANLDSAIDNADALLIQIDLEDEADQLVKEWGVICGLENEIETLSSLQCDAEGQIVSWRECVRKLQNLAQKWAATESVERKGTGLPIGGGLPETGPERDAWISKMWAVGRKRDKTLVKKDLADELDMKGADVEAAIDRHRKR